MDETKIFQIQRPHSRLFRLYLLRSILSGPFVFLSLPLLYFRYHSMKYRFDEEGVSMSWGILFRHEINLTYARIQDIHISSGIVQRWLGLADIQIQTASGSAAAEMTIEGLLEFEEVRDYLYQKMRGNRAGSGGQKASRGSAGNPGLSSAESAEVVAVLQEIRQEVRAARQALEQRNAGSGGGDV